MKRRVLLAAAAIVIVGLVAGSDGVRMPGLVLTDLQLISQESLPHWGASWTAPIQAATIAAWFAEHGYPALLPDLNGDGIIDELDTIELADRFGRGEMAAEAEVPPTDARLAVTLARYVAERYPDEFVMKLYDVGFPAEYAADYTGPFAADVVPGIELVLESEPTVYAYAFELASGEGVIVGLEETEEVNTYLSGRSFLHEETPEGYRPVDLAWSKENRVEAGHQGTVLDTVAKMEDRFYVDFRDWVLVEFMLALSPVRDPDVGSADCDPPSDTIGYHDESYLIGEQQGRIQECVTRDGPEDTYTYIITNVSVLYAGCGLCSFSVPNPGLPTIRHSEPAPWVFSASPTAWMWWLPLGSCGLLPGQTVVVSVTVPGPTVDRWVDADLGFGSCGTSFAVGAWPGVTVTVRTTGPGLSDCPDLVVAAIAGECLHRAASGTYAVVVSADIVNLGLAPAVGPFDVRLVDALGNELVMTVNDTVGPGGSHPIDFAYAFDVAGLPGPVCPLPFTVTADASGDIDECDERNNDRDGEVCCRESAGGPAGLECPDLVAEILEADCWYEWVGEEFIIRFEVEAEVTNVGGVGTGGSHYVRLEDDTGPAFDGEVLPPLGPGESRTVTLALGTITRLCPEFRVIADYHDAVAECDETNNEDSGVHCCPLIDW